MRRGVWVSAMMGIGLTVACGGNDDEMGVAGNGNATGGGFAAGGSLASGGTSLSGGTGPGSGGSPGSGGNEPPFGSESGGGESTGGTTEGGEGDGTGGALSGEPVFVEVTPSPSSGCEGDPSPPSGEMHLTVGGDERSYLVSLPENYDASTAYPVLFAFHGLGGSAQLVSGAFYFGLEQTGGRATIFVYPDGLDVQNGGGAGWDDFEGRDVAFFDALFSELQQNYCIDEHRVFSTGHSYGGIMTHNLACQRADVLRAVAPVAGAHFSRSSCGSGVAVWGTHGTNDHTVDYDAGLSAIGRLLETNGCEADVTAPYEPASHCESYACDAGLPVIWCTHEQEHDWPDFAAQSIKDFFDRF